MQASTKVVISGYYGFNNLGDEAVLYSMLQALRREIPGLEVTVLSNNPAATAQEYGVRSVDRWNLWAVVDAVRNSDLLLSGGGSLLQDVTGIKTLFYYLGVIMIARFFRRPVMYYAQGIGPVNTGLGRRLVGSVTQGVKAVTVRDEESLADLRQMGVVRPIEITADPVLGLGPEDINLISGAQVLRRNQVDPAPADAPAKRVRGRLIGVSVRSLPGPDNWMAELAGALSKLTLAGHTVVFVPMQNPADLEVSRKIGAKMQKRHVVIDEKIDVATMISLVGNLDLLIGMRLHALIFAAVCGVPPLGIVYDPKVERFLKRIGVAPAGSPEETKSEALVHMAEMFLTRSKEMRRDMAGQVRLLRAEALCTARLVNKILNFDL